MPGTVLIFRRHKINTSLASSSFFQQHCVWSHVESKATLTLLCLPYGRAGSCFPGRPTHVAGSTQSQAPRGCSLRVNSRGPSECSYRLSQEAASSAEPLPPTPQTSGGLCVLIKTVLLSRKASLLSNFLAARVPAKGETLSFRAKERAESRC